jgi:hypothetical protein
MSSLSDRSGATQTNFGIGQVQILANVWYLDTNLD